MPRSSGPRSRGSLAASGTSSRWLALAFAYAMAACGGDTTDPNPSGPGGSSFGNLTGLWDAGATTRSASSGSARRTRSRTRRRSMRSLVSPSPRWPPRGGAPAASRRADTSPAGSIGDIDGDGRGDLVFGAGPGGGPRVLTISGNVLLTQGALAAIASPLANFFVANSDSDRGGVRVAVTNADGDTKADVVVGTGEGQPSRVRVYLGKNYGGGEPAAFQDLDPFMGATLADGVYVG